ncbi:MAG: hypothetical protein H6R38_470 [Deltaproteobacteria bacterium]|nr:hypothetical protein [Deltaproteobacteria bacterium]
MGPGKPDALPLSHAGGDLHHQLLGALPEGKYA